MATTKQLLPPARLNSFYYVVPDVIAPTIKFVYRIVGGAMYATITLACQQITNKPKKIRVKFESNIVDVVHEDFSVLTWILRTVPCGWCKFALLDVDGRPVLETEHNINYKLG